MVKLEAIDIEMVKADDQFAFIVVVRAVGEEVFAALIDEARNLVNFLAGISGKLVSPLHRFGSFFGSHIAPGGVNRGNQDPGRRSRVDDIQRFLNIRPRKQGRMHKKNRTLGQRTHGLVE